MTARLYTATFTVPASTPIAAPFTQPIVLDDKLLTALKVIIPDGHNGLTGFAVTWGGTQIFPYGQGTWLTGNNEPVDWPYDGEVTAGGLVLQGYNTDIFPHSFLLRFTVSDLPSEASPVTITSPQAAPAAVADVAGVLTLAGEVPAP